MERQPPAKERSHRDREERGTAAARPPRQRRSGEGSESALASLRSMERDRARAVPADDDKEPAEP
jgi:hypothetical protein